ncbi:MAG: NFACT RNA binding domain-containing protein [Bacteroidota bacterium]|nr:NFACT RNA binding domain-containing protein [Bacteroidota bacterium]
MLNSYYVLNALAREWQGSLSGRVVHNAWTQAAGELSVALSAAPQWCTLTFLTHGPLLGAFVKPGCGRARRNQRAVFRQLSGQEIIRVRIVEGERILQIDTTGNLRLEAYLFGPRANVFLMDADGTPVGRFRTRLKGSPPDPRPAAMPESPQQFLERWATRQGMSAVKALSAVMPFFDRTLAAEALHRSGVEPGETHSSEGALRLYEAASELHRCLLDPCPRIYRNPLALALCPMVTRADSPAEEFADTDTAVRAYAQQALAQRAFQEAYEPRRKALVAALGKAHRSVDRLRRLQMVEDRQSQRYGDLLMAAPPQPPGAGRMELADLFQGGTPVQIPLNPALSSLENAEKYYERARNARRHRKHLDARVAREERRLKQLQANLGRLQAVRTMKELKVLDRDLAPMRASASGPRTLFRRYDLDGGYELRVGRNAKESELLTTRHARPFDLWLHARGVSGAHAVLRLPGRQDKPPAHLVEQAAAIAAWHSKARGSAIAAVIVTPRKYVRKAKGGAPGAMVVMREMEVLLVEPGLP